MKRGTVKIKPQKEVKQNLTSSKEVYQGGINRAYEGWPKFSINPKGERPYEIYSKKSLDQLQAKYKGCIVNPVKY